MSHQCTEACLTFSNPDPALGSSDMNSILGAPGALLYSALSLTGREIRLLHLAPGAYTDELKAQLFIVKLEDHPQYEALSYCWGKDISPHQTCVSGHYLSIGSSLDCALRHLRPTNSGSDRVIWIDALCINQADVHERGQQVQLMRDIYSTASHVVIWLGPGDKGSKSVFTNLRASTIPDSFNNRQEGLHLIQALTAVCNSPWFSRVWILQELLLAREDPDIYVGGDCVPWSKFLDFVASVVDKGRVFTIKAASDGDVTVPWPTKTCRILRQAASQLVMLGKLKENGIRADITTQVMWTQYAEATNPCDRVFGLLGICDFDRGHAISPDYTRTPAQVFHQLTAYWILVERSIPYDFLPLHPTRHLSQSPPLYPANPSWIIDLNLSYKERGMKLTYRYNQPHNLMPFGLRTSDLIARTNGIAPFMELSDDQNKLMTAGMYIGTVAVTTSDLLQSDDQEDDEKFELPASLIYDLYHQFLEPRGIPSYLLYLTMERSANTGRDSAEHFARFENFLKIRMETDHQDLVWGTPQSYMLTHLSLGCRNRILFITNEGHVGCSYHPDAENGIRSGDIVVGLFGINVPFILRKVPIVADPSNGRSHSALENYQMINMAHIGDHKYGHSFIESAPLGTKWQDLAHLGIRQYTII